MAGLEKLYIIAAGDLDDSTGSAYTTATNGTVSAITLDTGKTFVEVGLLKSTSGLDEEFKKDSTKGTAYWEQKFTLVLGDITEENRAFVESVMNQPVAILLRLRSGKYAVAGLNGLFELASATGGTGKSEADQIGYTLNFSGLDRSLVRLVDPTIISGLIA